MTQKTRINPNLISLAGKCIEMRLGLHFPENRLHDLERGIISVAAELGLPDAESCIRRLLDSSLTNEQTDLLARHLTVGETYFFRDIRSFEVLEEQILPDLIRSRRGKDQSLRIWSAGCSTGEEPYSLGILIDKNIPDLENWNITILATDINPLVLRKAREGVYGDWSFRETPDWVRNKYFRKTARGYKILQRIHGMVTFFYHNLVEDSYPSLVNNTNAIDIIFCRNVLMYFTPERAQEVVQKLHRCLVDGGWLIVSPVECSQSRFSRFETSGFPGAFLYRKAPDLGGQSSALKPAPNLGELEGITGEKSKTDSPREGTAIAPETGEAKPDDLYEEALSLYEQGRYAEAAEKAIFLSDKNHDVKAMALLSKICANQGRRSDASEWCEKAIASDKLNPSLHYLHATVLQELGRPEEAIASLKRAIYLDKDFALAHFAAGLLTRQLGKCGESARYFNTAASLLKRYGDDDLLPESEGMTAGRLMEIIMRVSDQGKKQEALL